jgi:hypothetical protein
MSTSAAGPRPSACRCTSRKGLGWQPARAESGPFVAGLLIQRGGCPSLDDGDEPERGDHQEQERLCEATQIAAKQGNLTHGISSGADPGEG